jgi:transposase
VLGLVMTGDGIPLAHYVFPGETPDKVTLKEVVRDLKCRFPIKRCVVVADRGLLSEDNLEVLSEAGLDYIVARPLRGNRLAQEVIGALGGSVKEHLARWRKEKTPLEKQECFLEATLEGRRFVVSHKEEIARQTKRTRKNALSQATSHLSWRVARTLGQLSGTIPAKGKVLSHQETLLHLHDYLRDRALGRYYRVWLDKDGVIQWEPNKKSRVWEQEIDGKLILETTNRTLSPKEIVHQYKELQDIERCFRTLKSSLDIRPVYHRVDRRIEAHIFICVMALQLHRLMRQRLRNAKVERSPERVLEKLSLHRTVEATANGKRIQGLVRASEEQLSLFQALNVPVPQHKHLANPAL